MLLGTTIKGHVEGNVDVVSGTTKLDSHGAFINGYFSCANTKIKTLEGSPHHVNGSFYCHNTKIKTLEGAPSYVGGNFVGHHTDMVSLHDIHKQVKYIGGVFIVPLTLTSHILGVLFIKGLVRLTLDGQTAMRSTFYAPYMPVAAGGGSGGSGGTLVNSGIGMAGGSGITVIGAGGGGGSGAGRSSGPSIGPGGRVGVGGVGGTGPHVISGTVIFEPHTPSKLQQAVDIINKHLNGDRNVHDAQQELIEANLSEFAKI